MSQFVEAKLTPPETDAAQLLAYGLKVQDYPANFYRPGEISYAQLFSAIGDLPLIYLPAADNYRGLGDAWASLVRLTARNPKTKRLWWRNSAGEPETRNFQTLVNTFRTLIQVADPTGEADRNRFGIALTLCLDQRNLYHVEGGQLRFTYGFAECYQLAQITVGVNTWAEILNIWEQGLPWDILIEIANGMSLSLMLELYQPQKRR